MIRIALAVIAGFALWSVLWIASNAGLEAAFPAAYAEERTAENVPVLVAILVLSVVFSIAAGYLTAAVGRGSGFLAAWILAVIQLGVGLFVQIQGWHLLPVWFHLPFLIMLAPGILFGARLRLDRRPAPRLA